LARNLEIKCRLDNFKIVRKRILEIKRFAFLNEIQVDVYYKIKKGRLKLRIINSERGSLIFYERKEKTSKRISNYLISETESFKELDAILRRQFEVLGIVHKKRDIYLENNIRIHLDSVKGLGKFLEIEVVYESLIKAKKQMEQLIVALGLDEKDFIKASYSDLLINKNNVSTKTGF